MRMGVAAYHKPTHWLCAALTRATRARHQDNSFAIRDKFNLEPDYDDPEWYEKVTDWQEFWNFTRWDVEMEVGGGVFWGAADCGCTRGASCMAAGTAGVHLGGTGGQERALCASGAPAPNTHSTHARTQGIDDDVDVAGNTARGMDYLIKMGNALNEIEQRTDVQQLITPAVRMGVRREPLSVLAPGIAAAACPPCFSPAPPPPTRTRCVPDPGPPTSLVTTRQPAEAARPQRHVGLPPGGAAQAGPAAAHVPARRARAV